MLSFAAKSDYSIVLNPLRIGEGFKTLYAFGNRNIVQGNVGNAFEEIAKLKESGATIFGYFSYELKNEIESLSSANYDHTHFPDYFFFQPRLMVREMEDELLLEYYEEDELYAQHFIEEISKKVESVFDMRPYFIEQRLKLRNPIYSETAAYGHMGRTPETVTKTFQLPNGAPKTVTVELFTWEKLDYVDKVKAAFGI